MMEKFNNNSSNIQRANTFDLSFLFLFVYKDERCCVKEDSIYTLHQQHSIRLHRLESQSSGSKWVQMGLNGQIASYSYGQLNTASSSYRELQLQIGVNDFAEKDFLTLTQLKISQCIGLCIGGEMGESELYGKKLWCKKVVV